MGRIGKSFRGERYHIITGTRHSPALGVRVNPTKRALVLTPKNSLRSSSRNQAALGNGSTTNRPLPPAGPRCKMPYLPDLNSYLHQSSLLIQAYPSTTRITTKYSLPRKPNPKSKSQAKSKPKPKAAATTTAAASTSSTNARPPPPPRERLPPSATLTLKTFEPGSGICLKYKTDKAAEVGRLLTGLGRLAGGEVIEMPAPPSTAAAVTAVTAEDKMEVDEAGSGSATPKVDEGKPAQGGTAGKGKKKGKK